MAEETLARLRTPLGLEIGAVTPEEIAVSILAELVGVRRGAVGGEADGGGSGGLGRARRRGAATEAAAQEEGG
jgi:hypothetical protein